VLLIASNALQNAMIGNDGPKPGLPSTPLA
jgi:hypothetical protein